MAESGCTRQQLHLGGIALINKKIVKSIKNLGFTFTSDDVKVINKVLAVPYDMVDPKVYGRDPIEFVNHCTGHALWGGIVVLKHHDVILDFIGGPLTLKEANGEKHTLKRKVACATYVAYATVEWCYSLRAVKEGTMPSIQRLVELLNSAISEVGCNDITDGLGDDVYYLGKDFNWYKKELPFHINPEFTTAQAPKPSQPLTISLAVGSDSGLFFTLKDIEVINEILTEPYQRKLSWDLWTVKETTKYLLGVSSIGVLNVCDGEPFLKRPLGVAEVNNKGYAHDIALRVYKAYLGALWWHRPNYLSPLRSWVLMSQVIKLEAKHNAKGDLGMSVHLMRMGIPGPKLTLDLWLKPLSLNHEPKPLSPWVLTFNRMKDTVSGTQDADPDALTNSALSHLRNSIEFSKPHCYLSHTEHSALK